MRIDSNVAAALLGVSRVALLHWRKAGTGPKWHEVRGVRGGGSGRRFEYDAKEIATLAFERRAQPLVDRLAALEDRLAALEGKGARDA